MGRHGKNLTRSIPLAKPMPTLGKYAYDWEKELVSDQVRRDMFNVGFQQGIYTALAATFRILIFHYHELESLRHRLPTFEMYFNTFFEAIGKPDDEQRFSEWYYEETTGFEFLRKEYETVANKEAKITVGEYVDGYIRKAGKTRAEVAVAINRGPKVLNALRAGNVSKKVIDAIMDYLGIEFTPGEMAVFKEAYGIGNNDTARFEQMETELLEREAIRQEVKAEGVADIPKEIQEVLEKAVASGEVGIPVPEELPEVVAEVIAHEELPFTEEAPMYEEPAIVPPMPSVVDLMQAQADKYREEQIAIDASIAEMEKMIEAQKERKAKLDAAACAIETNINIIKECGL